MWTCWGWCCREAREDPVIFNSRVMILILLGGVKEWRSGEVLLGGHVALGLRGGVVGR